ncbi:MAG TPA: DNA topoisomerase, partial [Syntrophales bacterium]|nr:DNA topoisomerase [Syntrophales bacterium]
TEKRRKPQAPYTTSKLQQEAYSRLGFSAANTMRIAQKLYEGVELGEEGSVGLITYMRTDSVNIAASAQDEAARYILEKFGKDYLPEKPPVYKSRKGAQEAHEAIRPTFVFRTPDSVRDFLESGERLTRFGRFFGGNSPDDHGVPFESGLPVTDHAAEFPDYAFFHEAPDDVQDLRLFQARGRGDFFERPLHQGDVFLDGGERFLFLRFCHGNVPILFSATGENRCDSISYLNNS